MKDKKCEMCAGRGCVACAGSGEEPKPWPWPQTLTSPRNVWTVHFSIDEVAVIEKASSEMGVTAVEVIRRAVQAFGELPVPSPAQFAGYFRRKGWNLTSRSATWAVFAQKDVQVGVPQMEHAPDYRRVARMLLADLAKLEMRQQAHVWTDVLADSGAVEIQNGLGRGE